MLSIASVASPASTRARTVASSLGVSIVLHLCAVTLLASIAARAGLRAVPEQTNTVRTAERIPPVHVVFLAPALPAAGGGGGGGGNRQTGPIRRAESPGRDAMTLRIAKPIVPSTRIVDAEAPPLPGLML